MRREPDAAALDLAASLEQVARRVRSGASITAALAETAPDHPDGFVGEVAARISAGIPFTDAVEQSGRAPGSTARDAEDRRLAGAVLSATHRAGGPGAAAIDRAAATVRERAAIRADRRAHAAQARLSARILSLLPVGFTSWTVLTDRRVAHFLLATPPGAGCLVTGVVLAAVGWRWMHRLVEAT
jgi:tight adherence protein B